MSTKISLLIGSIFYALLHSHVASFTNPLSCLVSGANFLVIYSIYSPSTFESVVDFPTLKGLFRYSIACCPSKVRHPNIYIPYLCLLIQFINIIQTYYSTLFISLLSYNAKKDIYFEKAKN